MEFTENAGSRGPLNQEAMRLARPTQPLALRKPGPFERRFVVFYTDDLDEAEQLRDLPESRGIACRLKGARSPGGRTVGDKDSLKRIVRVIVWEGDVDEARIFVGYLRLDSAANPPHNRGQQ